MDNEKPIIASKREAFPSTAIVVDSFQNSLEELFFIENPRFKKKVPEIEDAFRIFTAENQKNDCWVYYPWRNTIIHTVSEVLYFRLRTSRNRNIITEEEQQRYRNMSIGIAGLSVGSALLSAITVSGGPRTIKIADFDVLEVTNLNRIRGTLLDVGLNKAHVAARNVWELDPFADLQLFDQGITKDNLEDFLLGQPSLDVFLDEMDSIDLKIAARLICRKNKMPVLMLTDNGDGVILDVERFDLEPDRKIFHGLIPEMDPKDLQNLAYKDWLRLATQIVGPEYLTEAMQDSILAIGKTIPSVPQLGASAAMAGSAASFALRKIANGENMPSGRYTIGLEDKLVPHYLDADAIQKRKEKTEAFLKSFSNPT